MSNTLITPNLIKVSRAIVYTKASSVTPSTSATLLSLFSTVYNKAKNIVITPPKGEVVHEPLLGESAAATAPTQTFQNFIMDEKAWEGAKITGTLASDINEDNIDLAVNGAGTATVSGTYHWYQYGGSDSSKTRVQGAMLIVFKHGSGIKEVLLNNVFLTFGDEKSTGSDGHIERDFEGICAPQDYIKSFKD